MKCDIKEFIKPTLAKAVLFVVLFAGIGYYGGQALCSSAKFVGGVQSCGLPVGMQVTDCFPTVFNQGICSTATNWAGVLINIVFWYFVAAALVYAYNKMTKKG